MFMLVDQKKDNDVYLLVYVHVYKLFINSIVQKITNSCKKTSGFPFILHPSIRELFKDLF